jgi:hypothetical protein
MGPKVVKASTLQGLKPSTLIIICGTTEVVP